MYVYIVEERFAGQPTGFVKVGKATSPDERLQGLRSGNPRKLVVHSFFKCGNLTDSIEKAAHEKLRVHSVGGEWFSIAPDIAHACIDEIVKEQAATREGHQLYEQPKARAKTDDLLKALPAVYDLRDMEAYLGIKRLYGKKYSARWAERKLIRPLGPRAGVYFNLFVDSKGPQTRIAEAVRKLLRRPVVAIGAFALHQHGWTTQRPSGYELAVLMGGHVRTIPQMYGISTSGQRKEWFHAVLPHSEEGLAGFLTAAPEFALVHALMTDGKDGVWCPDPDDIDPPSDVDPVEAVSAIRRAADALGADRDMIEDYMSRIDALEDALAESSPRP